LVQCKGLCVKIPRIRFRDLRSPFPYFWCTTWFLLWHKQTKHCLVKVLKGSLCLLKLAKNSDGRRQL